MKIYTWLLLLTICSCNAGINKKNEIPVNPSQDSAQVLQGADGTAINLIDGYQVTDTVNDFILFPLKVKDAKAEEESALGFSKQRGEGNMYWNVVFYNYKTNKFFLRITIFFWK